MKKFNKKEIIALSVIGVLIIAVIVAGVIIITGNVNEANNGNTTATGETQVVTEVETDAQGNTVFVEVTQGEDATSETVKVYNPEYDTEEPTSSATKATTPKTTTATKKPTEKEDTDYDNNTSGNTGKVDVVTPETKPVEKDEDILTINGTKCNVGNTITVTLNAKTPVVLENYQGFMEFDNSCLEFVAVKGNVSGMFNEHESVIYYNGSDIGAGYDFTDKGTVFTATFKVIKEGSTKINNVIEVMSDQNSKPVDQTKCEYSIGIFN